MKNRTRIFANRDIRYKSVRVVSETGSELLSIHEAMLRAENDGLDLILINEKVSPPVCKIFELNKYRYEQHRKEKEAAKAQRNARITLKEIQFKPNIDDNDFMTKCRNIARFINKGNKVKVLVQFRGRERQHTELGYAIIDRVLNTVADIELDGKLQFSGNRITVILKGTKDDT